MVLPTEGKDPVDDTYHKNDKSTSYIKYLPIRLSKGTYQVKHGDNWLNIKGSIHTHPNNYRQGLSGEDTYAFKYGPAFVIDHANVWVGYTNKAGRDIQGVVGTSSSLLKGQITIIKHLGIYK